MEVTENTFIEGKIDWDKPLECDKGHVVKLGELHNKIEVGLGGVTNGLRYFVNKEHGWPVSEHLTDNRFRVRNVKTNRDKAIDMGEGYVRSKAHEDIPQFVDALIAAGLLKEDER